MGYWSSSGKWLILGLRNKIFACCSCRDILYTLPKLELLQCLNVGLISTYAYTVNRVKYDRSVFHGGLLYCRGIVVLHLPRKCPRVHGIRRV